MSAAPSGGRKGAFTLLDTDTSPPIVPTMEAESFTRSLRAFSRRMPFVPFTVELASGERVEVLHPEALAFNGGLAVYVAPDGTPSLFDHAGVTRLVGSPENRSATP